VATTLSNFTRYLPNLVLQNLQKTGHGVLAPRDDHFAAAVLFADISGFTALTESLAHKGSDGVEELTRILNAYFGQIISVVQEHGGDVIKFAGDALLAFWPNKSEQELSVMTRRAIQCALALQRSLKDFSAPGGVKLSLKVSVSAGDIRSLELGGMLNRWEFVVTGKPLSEAGQANDRGQKGDVVVSQAAWNLVQESVEGAVVEEGCVRILSVTEYLDTQKRHYTPIGDEFQGQVESYIPGAVRHRLHAGQTAWLGEFRRLTIIFVNLPEMTMELPLDQAQKAVVTLQSSLYHYEGSVNKLSVDDKGVSLVAAFGMPPLAHTDDPIRGIGAALKIQQLLSRMGWRHSIGVTTGETFCGSIGNEERCEYTVIGDLVNLSARLMQAAKGGLFCDATTYRAAKSRYHFEDLGEFEVKGKKQKISVYRPKSTIRNSTRAQIRNHEAVLGRYAERKALSVLLEEKAHKDAPIFHVTGQTGLGKSCLMAEIVHKSSQHNIVALVACGDAIEKNTPYLTWQRLFQRLLSPKSASQRVLDWSEQLETLLNDQHKILAPLLNVILPIEIPDNEFTEELSGEARATKTNELLGHLLDKTIEHNTILLVDDCQSLDSSSLSLLLHISQNITRLPIALFSQPFEEQEEPLILTQLRKSARTQRLSLGPLDEETTTEIVRSRLGVSEVPKQASDIIFQKSGGNPLFSIELAYSLRDGRALQIEDNECTVSPELKDLSKLGLPDTVQGVVTSRIDRLSAHEQLLLKVASTIGRTFDLPLLQDVYPITQDRAKCNEVLDGLIKKDLIADNEFNSGGNYIFKHVITQDVTYKLMLGEQRRSLHASIAAWHEAKHNDDLSKLHPLLAKHWRLAKEPAKAIVHLDLAGEQAVHNYANLEAVDFLQDALDQSLESPVDEMKRARWLCLLAEATYRLGDLNASLNHFSQGLELLGHPFPQSLFGMLIATNIEFFKQCLYRVFPKYFLGRASKEELPVLLQAAGCYERLAQIRYLNNAKVETLHSAFKSLNLSEKAGQSTELARSYSNAAVCNGLLLLHGVAQAHTQRALVVAEKADDRPCSAYVDFINGVYWITVGNWDECNQALERAVHTAEEIGDMRRYDESAFTLVNALARQGKFTESAELAKEIYQQANKRDVPQAMVWGLSGELWALLPSGDQSSRRLKILESRLSSVLERSERIPLADQILGHGFLSLSYSRHNHFEKSRRSADKAFELFTSTGQVSHYILEAHAALMSTTLALWQKEGKKSKMAKRAQRLLWGFAEFALMYPFAKARQKLLAGYVHQIKGNTWRSARAWNKTILVSQSLKMPYEEALAHQALGLHHKSQENMKQAREIFTRLGANYDLGRCDQE
jgi:class 3 adenylate cyclase/tetratricopeptide (TPR) repeat protein